MHDIFFTLPLYVVIPRKTKRDKNISLTLNWYRNAHFRLLSEVKIKYEQVIKDKIFINLPEKDTPHMFKKIKIEYVFYKNGNRRTDMTNWVAVIDKCVQDALVSNGFIEDDSTEYVVDVHPTFGGIDTMGKGRMEVRVSEVD